ncbi:MAG: Uma2 family endonuclease [Bacteroidota bacterium]
MKAYQLPKLSVKEYIHQERESGTKYEYHNGEIFALAGGIFNHGKLCGNIYSELRSHIKHQSKNCSAFTGEIKLHIQQRNAYVYPNAMVICGAVETAAEDKNAVTNPIVIVEVLSKSTADYDRGDKFHFYRQIPSLREYVLIEQDKAVVDVYFKQEGTDLWRISRFEGLEQRMVLNALGIQISMRELYYDIAELS